MTKTILSVVESYRRLRLPVRDYLAAILPGLADLPIGAFQTLLPRPKTIYVTNSGSNNVTVIDGQTDAIVSTVPVGTFPIAVAVDPKTNFIYVANNGDSQASIQGNVTVINGTTNTTTTLTDPKAIGPIAVAANSATNKIYVANWGSSNVTVIDGAHD